MVALVVDMTRTAGSVQFLENSNDEYLGMVGQNYKGLVIVQLRPGLRYVSSGRCRVGKVYKASTT